MSYLQLGVVLVLTLCRVDQHPVHHELLVKRDAHDLIFLAPMAKVANQAGKYKLPCKMRKIQSGVITATTPDG